MNDQVDDFSTPEDPGAQPTIEQQLAAVETELADTKDRLLRSLAEAENIRRRSAREAGDARKYAVADFAKATLDVADNLRRALDSMSEDQAPDERTLNLLSGVAATERQLQAALERAGIRKIEPLGEKFDHNFHQAMFELENTGQPPGTIVQLLQPGYIIHDRLLRPALVGVAKG